ncbi:phage terminase small subunit [Novosphingobium mangrovi (ex Hu et al. 2023)]|uniref:Phage terminase small subunit n=1 Tax=Novosphingobium mangrovi (ex Hu et al. 2023) TaxID=2930094 RepID=A0ABT0A8Y6_9SPHN|nr:phage terminase small subunit [Novosphingobium mangrovi (ex Hu et al. 2023)]MCJ1959661.1 phage terminase small subunit [Novosphingobium mangrovi (ex Hu et al. 2023)]
MLSPAQRHRQRTLAASTVRADIPRPGTSGAKWTSGPLPMPETGPVASEYQLLLAALGLDLASLREIQSTERKIDAKRAMIEKYRVWADSAATAWLAGDVPSTQDEIVATMAVWAIDIQDWPFAMKLARTLLGGHLALPERYKRTPATLIAEEVAEAAIANVEDVPLDVLQEVEDLVAGEDIFDQVRAKLEKALGLAFAHCADTFDATAPSATAGGQGGLLTASIGHFTRAIELHDSCGAKTLLRTAEGKLKKLADAKAAQDKADAEAEQAQADNAPPTETDPATPAP